MTARGPGPHFPFAAESGEWAPSLPLRGREKHVGGRDLSLFHEVGEKGPVAARFARRWEVRADAGEPRA